MDAYVPLLEEELAISGEDHRAPGWHKGSLAPDVEFSVAIIGAGMSGILAALRLQQAGVPFVVLEKNDDVGGTWFENTYPGCRVDVPNHFYSYSFAQKPDWPQYFSTQGRCCRVLPRVRRRVRRAPTHSLRDRSGVGARSTRRDAAGRSSVADGRRRRRRRRRARRGQRRRSAQPAASCPTSRASTASPDRRSTPRAGTTTSTCTASASPSSAPVPARRSSSRSSPSEVAELAIFQRTPNWFIPVPDYHDDVPRRPAVAASPTCRTTRTGTASGCSGRRPRACWPPPPSTPTGRATAPSVSEANEMLRVMLGVYLEAAVRRPSRPAREDGAEVPAGGEAHRARQRRLGPARSSARQRRPGHRADHEITPTGVVTADGVEHEVDVIIYGTGFQASRFLTPMQVDGRNGVDLHEQWDGDASAYLGITVPNFPNFFLPLRPEHQHRHQRQHHLLLRVRGAVRHGLPAPAARRASRARSTAAATSTTPTARHRRRQRPDGLGRRRR